LGRVRQTGRAGAETPEGMVQVGEVCLVRPEERG